MVTFNLIFCRSGIFGAEVARVLGGGIVPGKWRLILLFKHADCPYGSFNLCSLVLLVAFC